MPQIISIKDSKNTTELSKLCDRSEEPIYINKNGHRDMVSISSENFEKTGNKLKMYQDLEESEKQICMGNVTDARQSLSSMRKTYGL